MSGSNENTLKKFINGLMTNWSKNQNIAEELIS